MVHHETMTGAEILLKALVDQGVEVVFGYPGGAVLPIYDELGKQNRLRHVLVRHEQAAVHAAEGYARSTGKVGCVLVTSGPGATNAVTGLADAQCDSVPLVCLTGQVPTSLIGNDAFQEADITGITRPCTKHNYLVKDTNLLARTVHEAFHVARSGRPGPVLIDLPKDVVQGRGEYQPPSKVKSKYNPQVKGPLHDIEQAVELIAKAKRPVFYVGGGVINSGPAACQLLTQFVRMTGMPCTLTLMGLGAFPGSDPLFLGMLGMHGTYEANMAMHDCDVMVAIGARFDDRVTGRINAFSPHSKKIHIDIDPSSINKNVMVDVPVVGDCAHVLEDMIKVWKARQPRLDERALRAWWAQIEEWRAIDSLRYPASTEIIKPQYAIQRLYALTKDKNPYICTEVGQHQMWAAQHLRLDSPLHWLTSGGLGTMGYGLPAAMGVQTAHPDALVINIAGESSIQMNIQEMATLVQHNLPVKIVILNNQFMGMVRQWQELIHGSRYSESHMDHHPDFVKLADAFGAVGLRAERPDQVDDVFREMMAVNRPVIVELRTDASENVFPMIMPGMAHNEMVLGPEDRSRDNQGSEQDGMVLV
ncbi:acetolactate synthase 3 large subunit [Phaeospirillum tilakii]|uniref:Acetolactate synthase n=1 Tax=Phaeospirillum tilakii TaxID=741673 RepID=A0ABW5CCL0_9PROT